VIAGRRVRIIERQRRRQAAVAQRAQRLDRRVICLSAFEDSRVVSSSTSAAKTKASGASSTCGLS
jgi:hypothetical protein